MLLPAVLLHLGIDVLHEGVPLHQHVSERGAKKGPVKSETGIKVKKMNALLLYLVKMRTILELTGGKSVR